MKTNLVVLILSFVLAIVSDARPQEVNPHNNFPDIPHTKLPASGCECNPLKTVYLLFVSHNESTADYTTISPPPAGKINYNDEKAKLYDLADVININKAAWDIQSDYKFLEAAATDVSGGGTNVLFELDNSDYIEADCHSHETGPYNYTDVDVLHRNLGIASNHVMGGTLYNEKNGGRNYWTDYASPQPGVHFSSDSWYTKILTMAATKNHESDPEYFGAWYPEGTTASSFRRNSSVQPILYIAGGSDMQLYHTIVNPHLKIIDTSGKKTVIRDDPGKFCDVAYVTKKLEEIIEFRKSREGAGFFVQVISFGQSDLTRSKYDVIKDAQLIIDFVAPYVKTGQVCWKTFPDIYSAWMKCHFGKTYIYQLPADPLYLFLPPTGIGVK